MHMQTPRVEQNQPIGGGENAEKQNAPSERGKSQSGPPPTNLAPAEPNDKNAGHANEANDDSKKRLRGNTKLQKSHQ